jgi:hypothetical protein
MSQRRISKRQNVLPSLPYWRSILASLVLVFSMTLLFEVLTDPRSGQLRSPEVVAPVFGMFVLVESAIFYAEFRLRRRGPPAEFRGQRKAATWSKGDRVG